MESLSWQFVNAFLFTFLLVYFLLPQARRIGLVDEPNRRRKRHRHAVPLIGGLAIFASYVLMLGPAGWLSTHTLLFPAGGGLIILIGALDDYFDFKPLPRLIAQVGAALCMIAAGVVLTDLGGLAPGGTLMLLGVLAVPFTVFAAVGMINALNMTDGMDGLSGSLALVSLAGMLVIAAATGHTGMMHPLVVLGGCLLGFLLFNLRSPLHRRAAAFLGDAGSMFLGFALTWFLIELSQGADRAMPPVSALWLVALPLMEAVYSIGRRLVAKQSPLKADHRHVHHLLLARGFTVQQTVAILVLGGALLATVGVAGAIYHWPEIYLATAFACVFAVYCTSQSIAWRSVPDARARKAARIAAISLGPNPRLAARAVALGALPRRYSGWSKKIPEQELEA